MTALLSADVLNEERDNINFYGLIRKLQSTVEFETIGTLSFLLRAFGNTDNLAGVKCFEESECFLRAFYVAPMELQPKLSINGHRFVQRLVQRPNFTLQDVLDHCPLVTKHSYFDWFFDYVAKINARLSNVSPLLQHIALRLDANEYLSRVRALHFDTRSYTHYLYILEVGSYMLYYDPCCNYAVPNVLATLLEENGIGWRHRFRCAVANQVTYRWRIYASVVEHKISTLSSSQMTCLIYTHGSASKWSAICKSTRASDAEIENVLQNTQLTIASQSERKRYQWSIFHSDALEMLIALSPLNLPSLLQERIIRFTFGIAFNFVAFADVYDFCERVQNTRRRLQNASC